MITAIQVIHRVEGEREWESPEALTAAIETALTEASKLVEQKGLNAFAWRHGRDAWSEAWDARARLRSRLRLPSCDEVAVCEVAADLLEEGRIDVAKELLEQQAPNRLARRCPVCGAMVATECVELVATDGVRPKMLVPHLSRLGL